MYRKVRPKNITFFSLWYRITWAGLHHRADLLLWYLWRMMQVTPVMQVTPCYGMLQNREVEENHFDYYLLYMCKMYINTVGLKLYLIRRHTSRYIVLNSQKANKIRFLISFFYVFFSIYSFSLLSLTWTFKIINKKSSEPFKAI